MNNRKNKLGGRKYSLQNIIEAKLTYSKKPNPRFGQKKTIIHVLTPKV